MMRRPTLLCGSVRPVDQEADDDAYLHRGAPDKPERPSDRPPDKPQDKPLDKQRRPTAPGQERLGGQGQGRLSRVRRLLTGSLLRRRPGPPDPPSSPYFGVPFGKLDLNREGVPFLIVEMCTYLENNGEDLLYYRVTH